MCPTLNEPLGQSARWSQRPLNHLGQPSEEDAIRKSLLIRHRRRSLVNVDQIHQGWSFAIKTPADGEPASGTLGNISKTTRYSINQLVERFRPGLPAQSLDLTKASGDRSTPRLVQTMADLKYRFSIINTGPFIAKLLRVPIKSAQPVPPPASADH